MAASGPPVAWASTGASGPVYPTDKGGVVEGAVIGRGARGAVKVRQGLPAFTFAVTPPLMSSPLLSPPPLPSSSSLAAGGLGAGGLGGGGFGAAGGLGADGAALGMSGMLGIDGMSGVLNSGMAGISGALKSGVLNSGALKSGIDGMSTFGADGACQVREFFVQGDLS